MSRKDSKKDKAKASKKASGPATYLARVYVSLKPTVNDPEGITIGSALGSLGFDGPGRFGRAPREMRGGRARR